jgi:hypothetical protein
MPLPGEKQQQQQQQHFERTLEHSVPNIHTPPHQHTPYTTLCSAFSDGAAKPAPFGSWHSGER